MARFFITLLIDNHVYQYKLDEILQNSFQGYLNENFMSLEKKIYLPIIKVGDEYYIDNQNSQWSFRDETNDKEIKEKERLYSKMYVTVKNEYCKFAFSLLNYNNCTLSSVMYKLDPGEKIFIGRSPNMNIWVNHGTIDKKHAVIYREENGDCIIESLSNNTNLYVNCSKVTSSKLFPGDTVYLMEFSLIYCTGGIIIPSTIPTKNLNRVDNANIIPTSSEPNFDKYYIRTPRIYKSLSDNIITIEAPPEPEKHKEIPFILTAGPSLTMSMAMLVSLGVTISNTMSGGNIGSVITSGVMALSMLLGALFWPKMLRNYNNRQYLENEELRKKRYLQYLGEKDAEIRKYIERNTRIWNDNLSPSPQVLIDFINKKSHRLWERTYGDKDFLEVRLGLGSRISDIKVKSPENKFRMEDDLILNEAISKTEQYNIIHDVPITLSLYEKKVVGVVGDIYRVAKSIITNIVSLHAPNEVKLVMVYNIRQSAMLSFAKELHHVWSSDRKNRYIATTRSEVYSMFRSMDEHIQKRVDGSDRNTEKLPHYVIMVFDAEMVEDIPFRRYLTPKEDCGISTVFFGEHYNQIPKECQAIIQETNDGCGIYIKNENKNQFVAYQPDIITESDMRTMIEALSSIKTKTEKTEDSVPESVSFLDIYRVGNIADLNIQNRWHNNASHQTLAAPVGIRAGNEIFSLDIHEKYHGCHGLVAGTTGSGKSEFLQAYILSMMINYSPNEVSFVLIDFKGGDMARPFLGAPHLAATISNLSNSILYRAIISLDAEVKYRQKIFNEAAQNLRIDKLDINLYHKLFKENILSKPLPHLIVVIDEFAQLKKNYPEFMSKLIDIAQVGRSLGIHLILATQKPSGVVDPQIWSNSRFKVCLKVMDKQDSSDMIGCSDAATIKQPGRAYIQIGYNEVFELIQSGYSGAHYVPQETYVDLNDITVSMVNNPSETLRSVANVKKGLSGKNTQIQEIMSEIRRYGKALKLKVDSLWLEPLPEQLNFEACEPTYSAFIPENCDKTPVGKVILGKLDLPEIKQQPNFEMDFVKDGHVAVYGASGTGKSTFIHTLTYALAVKYSPNLLHLFVMDFNGGSLIELSSMPHCASYINDDDEEKVIEILSKIKSTANRRRKIFAESNCATYEAYLAVGKEPVPMILVIIDNYSVLRNRMSKSEEVLLDVISYAASCGIFFVITGNTKDAIYYKVLYHISKKIAFNMHDTYAYTNVFNMKPSFEPANFKGRCLVEYGTENQKQLVEMQVAVPFDSENESLRKQKLLQLYRDMAKCYKKITCYDFIVNEDEELITSDSKSLPKQEIKSVSKSSISSNEKKSKNLKSIEYSDSALIFGTHIINQKYIGFDLNNNPRIFIGDSYASLPIEVIAKRCANTGRTVYLITNKSIKSENSIFVIDDIDSFVNDICEKKLSNFMLIIDGFSDFYDRISDEAVEKLQKNMKNAEEYPVIVVDDLSRLQNYMNAELYIYCVKAKHGLIVGGNVDGAVNVVFNNLNDSVTNIPLEVRKLALSNNQALVYSGDECTHINIMRENIL